MCLCLCLCVCVLYGCALYVCIHVHLCVHVYVEEAGSQQILAVFVYHSPFYSFTEAGLLSEPGAHQFHYSAYPARFRDSQAPGRVPGVWMGHCNLLGLYMGSQDPNFSPHS